MNEEIKKKMLLISAILFKNNVPVNEAKEIGSFIEQLQQENINLKQKIDKAIEIFENEIKSLKERKRLIMPILTPENGYLKADIECELKRLERYLEILKDSDIK